MLLHLNENAECSLNIGLNFFEKYLNQGINTVLTKIYGNLKYAVIGVHNALELYMKSLLSQVNEILVYDMETINKTDVLKFLGNKYISKSKASLDYFMAGNDEKYNTITFETCAVRCENMFDINTNDREILLMLNKYRNALTHFAMDSIFNEHYMVNTLKKSLFILIEKIFPLLDSKDSGKFRAISKKIKKFINKHEKDFVEVWLACNEPIIEGYFRQIELFNDCKEVFEPTVGSVESVTCDDDKLSIVGSSSSIIIDIVDNIDKNCSVLLYNKNIIAILNYNEFSDKLSYYEPKNNITYEMYIKHKNVVSGSMDKKGLNAKAFNETLKKKIK